jgi:hypothetical protein
MNNKIRFHVLFVIQSKDNENIDFYETYQNAFLNLKKNQSIKLEIFDTLKNVCEYVELP